VARLTPAISAVVVNHRSAAEANACVSSLREAFAREGLRGEVVLVDCGSGAEELKRLRGAAADILVSLADNRGYSGGANAGLARASAGLLLVCNADVVFCPGAVSSLAESAGNRRVGASGPLCFWDSAGRLRLPPGFAPGFLRDFAQLATGRFPRWDRRRFRAFARQTLRLWREGGEAPHLTGAVLAVRRDVFDRIGWFDERFPFEYEESEWEDRARRAGYTLAYVPTARVHHLYARSSVRGAETAARRETSRELYVRERYGALRAWLLGGAASLARPSATVRLAEPLLERRPGAGLALSPNPSVMPFVGTTLDADFGLPADVRPSLPPGDLYLRVFRESDGEPLDTYVWENAA
jgi:GT2 family glycosyltransferase